MKDKVSISTVVASVVALSAAATQVQAGVPDQPKQWEKCAGIAKQAKNDCGSLDGKHGCAGQAKIDNDDNEWVYVPAGVCEKITGGRVAATKPAKS